MAKKDPTDLSVEEKLKTLFQLQTALSSIDEKRALRGELPLEVQDLEDEIEGLNTRVEKIQNEIGEFQKAIVQKKGEIVTAEASVNRYKSQLDEVKNNREFDTLSKEIEYQSLEIELCNKKIREAENRIQEKNDELATCNATIQERQEDLDIKKGELDEIIAETRAEEDKLKEKVKDLESKIEPRLLTSFKRIRKNARNGLGIVYVQRDACGGCFNKIPPQRPRARWREDRQGLGNRGKEDTQALHPQVGFIEEDNGCQRYGIIKDFRNQEYPEGINIFDCRNPSCSNSAQGRCSR